MYFDIRSRCCYILGEVEGKSIECEKPITHIVWDCDEGSGVCEEHSKGEYILGIDGKPFEVDSIEDIEKEFGDNLCE